MADELNMVEQIANTIQNTSPVTAFFLGAASVFVALNKRLFVTNDMAKMREENAALKAEVTYLKTHVADLEQRLDKLEGK